MGGLSAPAGAPSSGPPKGTQKKTNVETKTKPKKSQTSPSQQKKNLQVKQAASFDMRMVADMMPSEYAAFLDGARKVLNDEDYINFVEEATKYRIIGR
jgi:hypothetical protein